MATGISHSRGWCWNQGGGGDLKTSEITSVRERVWKLSPSVAVCCRAQEQGAQASFTIQPSIPHRKPFTLSRMTCPICGKPYGKRGKENQTDDVGGWRHHQEARWVGELALQWGDGQCVRVLQRNSTNRNYLYRYFYLYLYLCVYSKRFILRN